MKRGLNKSGWTIPKKGERSVRDKQHGREGQNIWYLLQELGFVNNWDKMFDRKSPWQSGGDIKTKWEEKLKNWLIWGYWEEDRY